MTETIQPVQMNKVEIHKPIILLILFIQFTFMVLSIKFGIVVLLFFSVFPLLFLLRKDLFWGIPIFIFLHLLIFKQTEGLTLNELIFAFFFLFFFTYWVVQKNLFKGESIFQKPIDLLLLFFLLMMMLSFIPAILFRGSILKWFRELMPILTLLMIFPIIDLSRTEKKLRLVIISFIALAFIVAIKNLLFYQQALQNVTMLWEYASARQTAHEPIFMSMIILSSSFLVLKKENLSKFISIFLSGFFTILLLITFSRGYWLASAIGILIIFLFLPIKRKILLILILLLFLILTAIIFQFVFGENYVKIFLAITSRFSSLESLTSDISMINRWIESKAVWAHIKQNPLLGYGLGKTYMFRPLIPRELPTWYVHNAYLYFWLKAGIFGLIALLLFFLKSIFNCYQSYKDYSNHKYAPLLLGIFSLLISLGIVSITSPQFIQKDSLLIFALSIGIVEILKRNNATFLKSH